MKKQDLLDIILDLPANRREQLSWLRSTIRIDGKPSGIGIAKAEGKHNGRANGSGLSDVDLVEKHSDIVEELNRGETIRRTARLTDKSKSTVQRVKNSISKKRCRQYRHLNHCAKTLG